MIPFPDEDPLDMRDIHSDIVYHKQGVILKMNEVEFAQFLNQSDVLDVQSLDKKAILRKSQRQIDQVISWMVFRRDGYACRYCGKNNVPLTVDHIDLWEDGGASVPENLNTCCRRCNKTRGHMRYNLWLASPEYAKLSEKLDPVYDRANYAVGQRFEELVKLRVKRRSR
jgi:hypothetical protein